ncbi:hypothetical protein GOP47_0013564 [Adiantum capillus-veneris]|uniref:Uncharacterized protein n=1 Tax=Adiantum capillus-veneris TaxID=13818 RepID=A0A9D4UQ05_ADICA|nr:hypothetical protein GOP47_0013564 [Adiantum capillus-veneris]
MVRSFYTCRRQSISTHCSKLLHHPPSEAKNSTGCTLSDTIPAPFYFLLLNARRFVPLLRATAYLLSCKADQRLISHLSI